MLYADSRLKLFKSSQVANPSLKSVPKKGNLPGASYGATVTFAADEEKKQAVVKAFQVRQVAYMLRPRC